jgi:S1-C subfamily serine protease
LLKVEEGSDTPALPGLRLGDGTKVKAGDRVWIGDLSPSTSGVEKVIWKEARLRPLSGNGNGDPRILPLALATPLQHSGGPVLNEQGEVIGMMLAPADAEHLFTNLGPLSADTGIAIKIQYPKWLLSMLPESEFVLPASMPRSQPVSTLIENAKPQVVIIKAAAR